MLSRHPRSSTPRSGRQRKERHTEQQVKGRPGKQQQKPTPELATGPATFSQQQHQKQEQESLHQILELPQLDLFMEVKEMPPPRPPSLKRREEGEQEEDKITKKETGLLERQLTVRKDGFRA